MKYTIDSNVTLELRTEKSNLLFKAEIDYNDVEDIYTEQSIDDTSKFIKSDEEEDENYGFFATNLALLIKNYESVKIYKSSQEEQMSCYICRNPLVWNADFDLKEVSEVEEGEEGISTLLSCNNKDCEVDMVEVTRRWEK